MRDPKRILEVLEKIKEVWEREPDMRLCQLLYAAAAQGGYGSTNLFYMEENQLLVGLRELENRWKHGL